LCGILPEYQEGVCNKSDLFWPNLTCINSYDLLWFILSDSLSYLCTNYLAWLVYLTRFHSYSHFVVWLISF
jgi:hypothetical protein